MSTAGAAANTERAARASGAIAENVTLATLASQQFGNFIGAATIGTGLVAVAQGVSQFRQAAESAGFVTESMIELDTAQRELAINAGRVANQILEPFTRLQQQTVERRNEQLESLATRLESGEDVGFGERARGAGLTAALAFQENVPVVGGLSKAIQPLTDAVFAWIRRDEERGGGGSTVIVSPELGAESRVIRDARALGHEGPAAVNPGAAFDVVR